MKADRKTRRIQRARKTRARLKLHQKNRLCVHRSAQHIYAQIISPDGNQTLASASSIEPELRKQLKTGGNVEAAKLVGTTIAERAIAAKLDNIGFDRSGHRYHGRVKQLAESAREAGLAF